ncbi:MAG: glutaredoxin family protein [Nitrospinae bacterium]|nr:glutaredoxin family protein [Nitrospinota bacterium]
MDAVKVYTTTWCPDCRAAKRVLNEQGVPFEEIDIEKNPSALEIVIAAKGKRVVPTLEYKGKYMDGNHFNQEKFEKELAELLQ